MNEKQTTIMRQLIRNKFDSLNWSGLITVADDLIAIANKCGFEDLANEMQCDLREALKTKA